MSTLQSQTYLSWFSTSQLGSW